MISKTIPVVKKIIREVVSEATQTGEGFARLGLFDWLENIEKKHHLTDLGMRAIRLKRDLIASAFGAQETATAEDFLTKYEVEQQKTAPALAPISKKP